MHDQTTATLSFVMKQDKISVFFALLQQGFQVTAKVGCDIQSLLCDQFGLMPDYLAHRISTIFLDGKPVDDVEAAMVRDGATLALSAAMPGLVGATFRRAGCLAAFRGSITYQKEDEAPAACYDGIITLKLFNLLVTEMGPPFLERGIWISGSDLRDVLRTHPSDIATIFKKIEKDGNGIDPDKIADLDWISPDAPYFLQATSEPGPTKTV